MTSAGKLALAVILAVAIATCPLLPAALGLAFGVTMAAATRFGAARTRRAVVRVAFFVAASVVPLAVSHGIEHATRVFVRAMMATATVIAIVGSIPQHELGAAFAALGVPEPVAALLAATLRQTTLLGEEARRLLLARKLRGYAGHRAGATFLAVLLSRAGARAERVDLAARLRGCSPARALGHARLARPDVAPLFGAAAVAIGIHAAGHFLR